MGVEAMMATTDTPPTPRVDLSSWAAIAGLAVAPLVYASVFNLIFRLDERLADSPNGLVVGVLFVLKVLTIASLAVGVHQIGNRISRRRSMAAIGAGIWSSVGVALVLVVAWAKEQGTSLGIDHLWPGRSNPELVDALSPGPGPGWHPSSIVAVEIMAVVVMPIVVAALLRLLARRPERLVVTALALGAVFLSLLAYDRIVGWPVMFDFDPFVGDAVLGILTYELGFFFAPVDPLGATSLAAIAIANSLILASAKPLTPTD